MSEAMVKTFMAQAWWTATATLINVTAIHTLVVNCAKTFFN